MKLVAGKFKQDWLTLPSAGCVISGDGGIRIVSADSATEEP